MGVLGLGFIGVLVKGLNLCYNNRDLSYGFLTMAT